MKTKARAKMMIQMNTKEKNLKISIVQKLVHLTMMIMIIKVMENIMILPTKHPNQKHRDGIK